MLDNKDIGKNLERARIKLGLNKAKFASPAGIDTSHYGRAERGIEGLGREKLHLLAEKHGVNADFLFTGREPILINETVIDNPIDPTVDKLAQALADQAKANRDQAEGYKTLAEAYKEMLLLMRDMRKEMARADTQATMDANLKRTLAGVLTLSNDYENAMKEIRDLFLQAKAHKKDPSAGVGKRRGRTDGRPEKTGKNPA